MRILTNNESHKKALKTIWEAYEKLKKKLIP